MSFFSIMPKFYELRTNVIILQYIIENMNFILYFS
jgi:hypothetical protein